MADVTVMELPAFDAWAPVPPPNPLAAEERAFARLLPELLTTHRGQYVAILGGQVVGSGAEEVATLKQAYAEHGYRPILVRLVSDAPPRVARFHSVWRGGPPLATDASTITFEKCADDVVPSGDVGGM